MLTSVLFLLTLSSVQCYTSMAMKYEIPDTNRENLDKVWSKFAELKKAKEVVSSLETEIEELIEKNNLQSHFKTVEDKEETTPKKPRNVNIHIKHLRMEKLLKTPAVVDTFFNLVKQSQPELTEEQYNKTIEYYISKKWLEKKDKHGKTTFNWIKP